MGKCNLEMNDDCYGCPYYGTGDTEGCRLTIAFHKKYPNHTDEEYKQYMISNRIKSKKNMAQYINKAAVVAEIKRRIKCAIYDVENSAIESRVVSKTLNLLLPFLDTLEVKEVVDNSLAKFKFLQHIDKDSYQSLADWGYAPNLYYFDGSWHVDWISCEEGDSIKCFTGCTAEEAIDKAYNWFYSNYTFKNPNQ